MLMLDPKILEQEMTRAFRDVGVVEPAIACVVGSMLETSLRGVDSHGINLFPHYHRATRSGRIATNPDLRIEERGPAAVLVDAGHAFGHHAGTVAVRECVLRSRSQGTALAVVKNSTHFGAAAYFALRGAEQGQIVFAFTNADALVRAANGTVSMFGTNPICITAPMAGEGPLCLDMATSTVSWNLVKNRRRENQSLAPGLAFDERGQPTIDPHAARMLEGSGGYKGYGLGMMIDVLCGMLADGPVGKELLAMYGAPIEARRHISHCFIALDIQRFVPLERFQTRLTALAEEIRALPNTGTSVMVPGDPEKQRFAERSRAGIPIDSQIFEEFVEIRPEFRAAVR